MAHNPKPSRLSCFEITVLALLAAVFGLGLLVNWISLLHALAAVGAFGAAVGMAWLWQRTVRESETASEGLPEADDKLKEPR